MHQELQLHATNITVIYIKLHDLILPVWIMISVRILNVTLTLMFNPEV